jgi:hypothetical protein
MKSIEKFGKRITYHVGGAKGSWMCVEEGGDSWFYVTKNDMDYPNTYGAPIFINKKGMHDLLIHFVGGNQSYVFKKD